MILTIYVWIEREKERMHTTPGGHAYEARGHGAEGGAAGGDMGGGEHWGQPLQVSHVHRTSHDFLRFCLLVHELRHCAGGDEGGATGSGDTGEGGAVGSGSIGGDGGGEKGNVNRTRTPLVYSAPEPMM